MFSRQSFLAIFFIAFSSSARATFIGFDNLPNGTVVTNQYAGVVFSSSVGAENRAYTYPTAHSLSNILCSFPLAGEGGCVDPTIIDFLIPVSGLSLWAIEPNNPGLAAHVKVIHNFGVNTSNLSFNGLNGPGNKFIDLTAFLAVTRVELTIDSNELSFAGVGWDSIQYEAVPEPGLLSSLVAAFLIFSRRKRIQ